MPVTFPDQPLGWVLEAAFGADLTAPPAGWTWTDITPWWEGPEPITLEWGRKERAKTAEPVQVTFRLNNLDGRFTPDDARSPYWPHVVEQVPIRLSIDPGTGMVERFAGFVAAWPISWPGRTPHKVTVDITARGVMQRLGATSLPLRSALYRAITSLPVAPAAYWSLEDGAATTRAAPGIAGGTPMSANGPVKFGAEGPPGATGGISVNDGGGRLTGPVVGMSPNPGGWLVSCWMDLPFEDAADAPYIAVDWSTPTAPDWQRYLLMVGNSNTGTPVGRLFLGRFPEPNGNGEIIGAGAVDLRGRGWTHVIVRGVKEDDIGNVTYEIYVDGVLDSSIPQVDTLAPIQTMRVSNGLGFGVGITDLSVNASGTVSHLAVTGPDRLGDYTSAVYEAGLGHVGEPAAARIARLCAEEGIPATILGDPATSEPMGPQPADGLLVILQECEDADKGYLGDGTGHGITYLPRTAIYNQPVALQLDAAAGELAFPFEPVRDDAATRNEWSVAREGGSAALVIDQEHQRSRGRYADSETINVLGDDRLADHAGWLVHLGTARGLRYPSISVDLTRHPNLIPAWLSARPSSRVRATNLPPQHPLGGFDQLIDGATESLTRQTWSVTCNVSPAKPWDIGVLDDPVLGRLDTDGAQLATAAAAGDTTLSVLTTDGPLWVTNPAEMPFNVEVGGEVVTVTGITSTVTDTFSRTVTGGWGTSDSGHDWNVTPTASEFAADGSAGTIAVAAINTARRALLPSTLLLADLDLYFTVSSPAAVGANIEASAMLRIDPANAGGTYLYCEVEFTPAGAVTARLASRVSSTDATIVGPVTVPGLIHAAGVPFRVRAQVIGNTVRMKVWRAAGTEPLAWTLSGVASAITAAGRAGVRSVVNTGSTNTLPVAVRFDDVQIVNPQTFAVTRAVNGVSKPQPAGADVRLAHPMILAL